VTFIFSHFLFVPLSPIYKTLDLKTFEELGVCEEIRRAIEELGFTQPMPVQEEVIPFLLGTGTT
jgi:ATP-dependent RNA helicase DeaD